MLIQARMIGFNHPCFLFLRKKALCILQIFGDKLCKSVSFFAKSLPFFRQICYSDTREVCDSFSETGDVIAI